MSPKAKNESRRYVSGWCANGRHEKCQTPICTCRHHLEQDAEVDYVGVRD